MEGEDEDDAMLDDDLEYWNIVNQPTTPKPKNYEEIPGFNETEGETWVYPVNYPLRSYQYNIVQKALFWNTLVTLPTGLGKTFVAAVVIHNFYRWYPEGKILFMAPTKPLVAQQIRACHDIVGIPQSDLGELTGNIPAARRDKIWTSKRVFFLTPQIVQNDLSRGVCPAKEIVLLVVDEAHKATGNHAYCQVVRELQNYTTQFRVLALSATPGDKLETVQSVLSNLLIAHVEIRSEESLDIQPYTHDRKIQKSLVKIEGPLAHIRDHFIIDVLDGYFQVLSRNKALYCSTEVSNISKFMLIQQRDGWRSRTHGNLPPQQCSAIEGAFAVLMTLSHAMELLVVHGISVFLSYCLEVTQKTSGVSSRLQRDQAFISLIDKIRRWKNLGCAPELNNARFVDHPKLPKLLGYLHNHFASTPDTRAMVFSSYRDSVQDLVKNINREEGDQLKATAFVGQSGEKGLKQKQQLQTVADFKSGKFNILVGL